MTLHMSGPIGTPKIEVPDNYCSKLQKEQRYDYEKKDFENGQRQSGL